MKSTKHNGNTITQRANSIGALFLFFALVIVVRFASLQLTDGNGRIVLKSAAGISTVSRDTNERGEIFVHDRFGARMPLAINKEWYTVSAEPRSIRDGAEIAEALARILHISKEDIGAKLAKENDPYEVIASRVGDAAAKQIAELHMDGIRIVPQRGRHYPYEHSASHLAGFLGIRNDARIGQYGLEGFYEDVLGNDGAVAKLILSIDPNVQFAIEEQLKTVVEKWDASGGSAIVMEPSTGRVLGMANMPSFDPNEYAQEKDIAVFTNAAISSQLELGSVFKPITMAVGLNEKAVTPDTVYEDTGAVVLGKYVIKNFDNKAHGMQTMTQVLENSLNTGVVFVQKKIPKETMRTYIRNFGFGQKTGIDLQGEAGGDVRNLDKGRDLEYATASFGQGISVTPLQMLAAISAIANKGVLMKPRIVDALTLRDDTTTETEAVVVRSVIAPEAAESLTKMLVSTVENGYDKAKVRGYFVAGKTGTAQIPNPDGKGYLADETIHTFVGYAPAYHPQFSVLLMINRPKGVRFASSSLAPIFSNIMSYLLTYYEIPPDFK